jgi:hypothetical protein
VTRIPRLRGIAGALALVGASATLAIGAGPAQGGVVDDLLAVLLGGGAGGGGAAGGTDGNAASRPLGGTLRTATTGNRSELRKTIRIGKRADDHRTVVMSVNPGNLGPLRDGDVLYATAEVEVSVCLKPDTDSGYHRECVGRTYGFDPTVSAELVLGDGGQAAGGARTVPLARKRLTCTQRQPNRNHHCVLVIDDGVLRVGDASSLPCNPETCHVNLVLTAHDRGAKPGDRLVVGADSGGRSVNGDKGRINVSRFRPGRLDPVRPTISKRPVRHAIPIAPEGGNVHEKAAYSVALPDLRAGDQLVIDGKLVSRIGMHPYNVFQTTGIVLSEGPGSASREGWPERVGDLNGQIAEANGFNCTQGDSAHEDPCTARKVGVLEITRDAPKTLYVNLVAGMAAQYDTAHRHHSGDKARVAGGFLRVYRFPRDRNDAPPPVRE